MHLTIYAVLLNDQECLIGTTKVAIFINYLLLFWLSLYLFYFDSGLIL